MEIRNELLNSDVYISVEKDSHDIELQFIADWIPEEGIVLKCRKVHCYQVACNPDRKPPFPLGEVHVYEDVFKNRLAKGWKVPSNEEDMKVWVVPVQGLIEIEIVCLELQWEIPNDYNGLLSGSLA